MDSEPESPNPIDLVIYHWGTFLIS